MNKVILLVDDDPVFMDSVKQVLDLFNAFLTKPVTREELLNEVETLLE